MIQTATVGPLWGSEMQPEPSSLGETSGKHLHCSTPGATNDCDSYWLPSPGHGNADKAEIMGRGVWEALQSQHTGRDQ